MVPLTVLVIGTTTFNLPDLRGEFVRGWDDGRGIDSGRAFASVQNSANKSHSHSITDPGHEHTMTVSDDNRTVADGAAGGGNVISSGTTDSEQTGITIDNDGLTMKHVPVTLLCSTASSPNK